jgi:hypothetical protein
MLLRRDDPALSLTVKAIVDVGPSIVDATSLKTPAHQQVPIAVIVA